MTREGCIRSHGYRYIGIGNREYAAHRLAWFYMHGVWPRRQIDHVNGIRDDNRAKNLREASPQQNNFNQKTPVTNTSGYKGVSWNKRDQNWEASIQINRKHIHLGRFSTPESAALVYAAKASELFGEFANPIAA